MKIIIILLSIFMLKSTAYANVDPQTQVIEAKLKKSLENVKNFKKRKNDEIKMLNAEIDQLKSTIRQMKRNHNYVQRKHKNTIKQLKNQLNMNDNDFYLLYEENKKLKEALLKYQKNIPIENSIPIEKNIPIQNSSPAIQEPLSQGNTSMINQAIKPINVPVEWVEVVIEDDMSIYELALQYYGKESAYTEIYRANKNVIPETLRLVNGMSLKLPITDNFRERPMILNAN